jgi:hypothetical protein
LFTAHQDKRVVVWDTSKLADVVSDDRNSNAILIKELLTLEEHQRGVTSVAVAPNGQNLLSAGVEGRTIIWAGDPVTPISMTLSRNQLTYNTGDEMIQIDARAAMNDPSRVADFGQAWLTITLDGDSLGGESVTFGSAAARAGATIEVVEDQRVVYRPHPSTAAVSIGTLVASQDSDTYALRVELNQDADAMAIQALLRALHYGAPPQQPIAPSLSAGTPDASLDAVSSAWQRRVKIRLAGIRYRDGLDDSMVGSGLSQELEAEIVVDVQGESREREEASGMVTLPAEASDR